MDKIEGYAHQVLLGRCNKIANHVVVFIRKGLKKWKHLIAYDLTKDVKTFNLQAVLSDAIGALQLKGLKVVCTRYLCDQKQPIWIV